MRLHATSRSIIGWGLFLFVMINAFSWNPGYGGRNDRQPGQEIERYFGWPAVFYCDLWRSDHTREYALPAYFPPIPLSREMSFVYCAWSAMAFALNAVTVACGTGIVLIVAKSEREHWRAWMMAACVALAAVTWLVIQMAHPYGAYL